MLLQVSGILIEGHPTAAYNGVYTHDSTHEGWPVLKNASGKYCYRYKPKDQWFLRNKFKPDDSATNSKIVAKEGPLPVGAQTWQWGDGKKFHDRTLTVGLLVRPRCPPQPHHRWV